MIGLVIPQDERLSGSDLSPPPRPRLTGHRRIYVAFKYCRGRQNYMLFLDRLNYNIYTKII